MCDTAKRLSAYALAAVSAGVGLRAVPAHGEIVYTPTNVSIKRGSIFIDLNGDSINDFQIEDNHYLLFRTSAVGRVKLLMGGATSAGVITQNGRVAVLPPGFNIGSSRVFRDVQPPVQMAGVVDVQVGSYTINVYVYSNWPNVRDRYVGLRFQINGEFHYGWARLSTNSYKVVRDTSPRECCIGEVRVNLTGYAYETNPGQSIAAGDTGGAGTSSEAGADKQTLGTLALGSLARQR